MIRNHGRIAKAPFGRFTVQHRQHCPCVIVPEVDVGSIVIFLLLHLANDIVQHFEDRSEEEPLQCEALKGNSHLTTCSKSERIPFLPDWSHLFSPPKRASFPQS